MDAWTGRASATPCGSSGAPTAAGLPGPRAAWAGPDTTTISTPDATAHEPPGRSSSRSSAGKLAVLGAEPGYRELPGPGSHVSAYCDGSTSTFAGAPGRHRRGAVTVCARAGSALAYP